MSIDLLLSTCLYMLMYALDLGSGLVAQCGLAYVGLRFCHNYHIQVVTMLAL